MPSIFGVDKRGGRTPGVRSSKGPSKRIAAFLVNKKTLAILAAAVLMTSTPKPASADTSWLSDNWTRRVPITITELSGSTLSSYPLALTVNTQTPITLGKMQSGGQDIRFADNDGATPLEYWYWEGLDNNVIPHTVSNGVINIMLQDIRKGYHALSVAATDTSNNRNSIDISFMVDLPPMPVPENMPKNIIENIKPSEVPKVENVRAGQPIQFVFTGDLTTVTVTPASDIENMILRMTLYENIDTIPIAADNTKTLYLVFEVDLKVNGADSNQSKAVKTLTFEFKVPRNWLEEENIGEVKLYHKSDNSDAWAAVPTRYLREDYDYRYYEAQVSGLSMFSIIGVRTPVVTPAPIIVNPNPAPVLTLPPSISLELLAVMSAAIGAGSFGAVYLIASRRRRKVERIYVPVAPKREEVLERAEAKAKGAPTAEEILERAERRAGAAPGKAPAARQRRTHRVRPDTTRRRTKPRGRRS